MFKSFLFSNKKLNIIFSSIILVSYIGFGILGFMHMIDMAEMNMPMSDCPFSQIENSVCLLSTSNQMKGIQEAITFIASFVVFKIALSTFGLILVSFYVLVTLRRYILYAKQNLNKQRYIFQELFSQGILNPKTF